MARSTKATGGSGKGKPRTPHEEMAQLPKNGILIAVERNGEEMKIEVAPFGDVKQTEVPVLLGVARNLKEEQLGIGRG